MFVTMANFGRVQYAFEWATTEHALVWSAVQLFFVGMTLMVIKQQLHIAASLGRSQAGNSVIANREV